MAITTTVPTEQEKAIYIYREQIWDFFYDRKKAFEMTTPDFSQIIVQEVMNIGKYYLQKETGVMHEWSIVSENWEAKPTK